MISNYSTFVFIFCFKFPPLFCWSHLYGFVWQVKDHVIIYTRILQNINIQNLKRASAFIDIQDRYRDVQTQTHTRTSTYVVCTYISKLVLMLCLHMCLWRCRFFSCHFWCLCPICCNFYFLPNYLTSLAIPHWLNQSLTLATLRRPRQRNPIVCYAS